ncbi:uncharacterized [Tachysurus ichikawai]
MKYSSQNRFHLLSLINPIHIHQGASRDADGAVHHSVAGDAGERFSAELCANIPDESLSPLMAQGMTSHGINATLLSSQHNKQLAAITVSCSSR